MTTTDTAVNAKVQDLIERQIAEGRQLGVQVCAYKDGERIVDAWAGVMGPHDPRPVGPDTLFNCFSTTKGVAATALHILADRGLIDYDAPVARYWPQFGANGKERVTVAQAMSHQAGLRWVANGVPALPPGTATGYHAITYAWIVGGIVQGASGRHTKDVIREEIAVPLGVASDMFCGIPDGVEERLATLEGPAPGRATAMPIPLDHDFFKAMPLTLTWNLYNDMRVRRACIPSANGHFTARALAKMYGALANGGAIDGARLVSQERLPLMQRVLTEEVDRVLMLPILKGVGFMFGGNRGGLRSVSGPRPSAFGHSGAGGSTAFADPEVGLAVAVTINKMQMTLQAEGPTFEICELIRRELGVA